MSHALSVTKKHEPFWSTKYDCFLLNKLFYAPFMHHEVTKEFFNFNIS